MALICNVLFPPVSLCLQTYIFTDGEDEELKKKIGRFYGGDFMAGNKEEHCLNQKKKQYMLEMLEKREKS